jgi:hypothetical protein
VEGTSADPTPPRLAEPDLLFRGCPRSEAAERLIDACSIVILRAPASLAPPFHRLRGTSRTMSSATVAGTTSATPSVRTGPTPLAKLARAGIDASPELVLADAGYWHHIQMERLVSDGMAVLVAPDAKRPPDPNGA